MRSASSTQRPKGHSNFILKLLEAQGRVSLFNLEIAWVAVICRGIIHVAEKSWRLAELQVKPFRSSHVSRGMHALLGFFTTCTMGFWHRIWGRTDIHACQTKCFL